MKHLSDYAMTHTVQTKPWTEVVNLYEALALSRDHAFEPMLRLARFIASSRYADGMFASLSGETLCIGKTPNFTAGNNELRIDFDETKQAFTFTHAQRPDEKFPWSLSCSATEWQPTFERLVHKRLRWFHEG